VTNILDEMMRRDDIPAERLDEYDELEEQDADVPRGSREGLKLGD